MLATNLFLRTQELVLNLCFYGFCIIYSAHLLVTGVRLTENLKQRYKVDIWA